MIFYALQHSSYETKVAIVSVFKGEETAFELREPPVGLRTETCRGVVPMCNFGRQVSERERDLAVV